MPQGHQENVELRTVELQSSRHLLSLYNNHFRTKEKHYIPLSNKLLSVSGNAPFKLGSTTNVHRSWFAAYNTFYPLNKSIHDCDCVLLGILAQILCRWNVDCCQYALLLPLPSTCSWVLLGTTLIIKKHKNIKFDSSSAQLFI